jgi:hypothetical protein
VCIQGIRQKGHIRFFNLFIHLKEKIGAAEGTRTPDPIITNDVLYQLSYSGLVSFRRSTPRALLIASARGHV